jgi:FKBP-type peptidyl-prolyl cis-trans isomerase (trigger factor)
MLLDLVEVDPPAAMLASRVEEKLHDFKEQFTNPYTFDDYLSEWNRTEEDVRAELREGAERICKIEFALDEVASRESITATDEELAHRLRLLARVLHRSPMDVEEMIDSSGSRVLEKQKLTREKAFGWLKSRQSQG